MAFTANTAFEARITNNINDELCNVAGLYQDENENALDCSAGTLVKRFMLAPCEGFTGVKNENTWIMVNAVSEDTVDTVIYACNTYDTQLLSDGAGNSYFIGSKTLGLGVPAGRYGNFTRINFDGQSVYRFGIGNVYGTITATTGFLTIDAGKLVPTTDTPAVGVPYFEIQGQGNFIEGNTNSFGYVDARACKRTA